MQVEILFKIAAVGILVMVINQVLAKSGRDDLATLASLAGVVIVLMMVMNLVMSLFDNVRSVFQFLIGGGHAASQDHFRGTSRADALPCAKSTALWRRWPWRLPQASSWC